MEIVLFTIENIPLHILNLNDEDYISNTKKFKRKGRFYKWYMRKFILPSVTKIICSIKSLGIVLSLRDYIPREFPITVINDYGDEVTYLSSSEEFGITPFPRIFGGKKKK